MRDLSFTMHSISKLKVGRHRMRRLRSLCEQNAEEKEHKSSSCMSSTLKSSRKSPSEKTRCVSISCSNADQAPLVAHLEFLCVSKEALTTICCLFKKKLPFPLDLIKYGTPAENFHRCSKMLNRRQLTFLISRPCNVMRRRPLTAPGPDWSRRK